MKNDILIAKLNAGHRDLLDAERSGDEQQITRAKEANKALLEEAADAAGIDRATLARDMTVLEDDLIKAASALGALYGASGLLELKALAYALIDDLSAWAVGAHARDETLGLAEIGGLLQTEAVLREPDAAARFRAAVEERHGSGGNPGRRLVADRAKLLRLAYGLTEDEDTLIQLMTFKVMGTLLRDALHTVGQVAGEADFGRTATAMLALVASMRQLALVGRAIHERTGTRLVFGTWPPVMASLDALEGGMRYALEHGSDAGFDYKAANAKVRAAIEMTKESTPTTYSALDEAVRGGQEADVHRAMEEAA